MSGNRIMALLLFLALLAVSVPLEAADQKKACSLLQLLDKCCPEDVGPVQCANDIIKVLEDWLNKGFTILVTGKMGTGKTTLVWGLTGWKSNTSEDDVNTLKRHTTSKKPYNVIRDRINFTLYDTPGLQDEPGGRNDSKYLENMHMPDVLIFTMKMNDHKFQEEDMETIKAISNAFGWKVWERSMFLLTFANMVKNPDSDKARKNEIYYHRRRDDFAESVTDVLEELGAEEDVANKISVLPVGLVTEPFIPSGNRKVSWVDEFWERVFVILKQTSEISINQNKSDNSDNEQVDHNSGAKAGDQNSGDEQVESGTEKDSEKEEDWDTEDVEDSEADKHSEL